MCCWFFSISHWEITSLPQCTPNALINLKLALNANKTKCMLSLMSRECWLQQFTYIHRDRFWWWTWIPWHVAWWKVLLLKRKNLNCSKAPPWVVGRGLLKQHSRCNLYTCISHSRGVLLMYCGRLVVLQEHSDQEHSEFLCNWTVSGSCYSLT